MVELKSIKIGVEGLKILPIENYYDLTSSLNVYYKSPSDGGLNFKSQAVVNGLEDGFVYTTQICTQHTLKIKTTKSEYLFDSQGETFKDTPNKNSCHLKLFPIKNNIITNFGADKNEITFFDAPFIELFSWWTEIEYNIKFETWIQYSESPEINKDIKPILKFNWELNALASQENGLWEIKNSKFSSEESIVNSIQEFRPSENPLLTCDLRHLGTSVREFRLQHEELQNIKAST